MTMMDTAKAAQLLGAKESEIVSIGDAPAGVVIATADGGAYIVVPDDRPDREGKTGLMLLAAPSDAPVLFDEATQRTCWNAFPLYVSDVELTDDGDGPSSELSPPAPVDGSVDLESLTLQQLQDLPAAAEFSAAQKKTKKAILEAFADLSSVATVTGAAADLVDLTDEELADLAAQHDVDVEDLDRDQAIATIAAFLDSTGGA
jgi:hypothetical protein